MKNQSERNEKRKGVEGWERKVWAAAQVQRPAQEQRMTWYSGQKTEGSANDPVTVEFELR